MERIESNIQETNENVFFLNHELRRSVSNLVGLCEILKTHDSHKNDKEEIYDLMKKSLADFDQVIREYEQKVTTLKRLPF